MCMHANVSLHCGTTHACCSSVYSAMTLAVHGSLLCPTYAIGPCLLCSHQRYTMVCHMTCSEPASSKTSVAAGCSDTYQRKPPGKHGQLEQYVNVEAMQRDDAAHKVQLYNIATCTFEN